MNEIWKDIEGYEGCYQVSNLGRVKSLERSYINSRGRVRRTKESIIKQFIEKRGYSLVVLSHKGSKKTFQTHRLVALAFIPNIDNKATVNHKNFNKSENTVDNIEWMSVAENNQHAIDAGVITGPKGKRCMIWNGINKHIFDTAKASDEFIGCARGGTSDVCRGKTNSIYGWKAKWIEVV